MNSKYILDLTYEKTYWFIFFIQKHYTNYSQYQTLTQPGTGFFWPLQGMNCGGGGGDGGGGGGGWHISLTYINPLDLFDCNLNSIVAQE